MLHVHINIGSNLGDREDNIKRATASLLQLASYGFAILPAARKTWTACQNSGINPANHFVPFNEMVPIGSGAERQIDNIKMTRYACYLSVQNAIPVNLMSSEAQQKRLENKNKRD